MPKPAERAYSRNVTEAIALLGQLIRAGRIESRMTTQELAARAGISRALLYRIEHGDPACSIGVVFEAAAIAGVSLLEPDHVASAATAHPRAAQRLAASNRLAVLPKTVRTKAKALKDDF